MHFFADRAFCLNRRAGGSNGRRFDRHCLEHAWIARPMMRGSLAAFAAGVGSPQEAGQLGESHLINVALELDDRIQRYPILVPAPGIELRMVRRTQADVAITSH